MKTKLNDDVVACGVWGGGINKNGGGEARVSHHKNKKVMGSILVVVVLCGSRRW